MIVFEDGPLNGTHIMPTYVASQMKRLRVGKQEGDFAAVPDEEHGWAAYRVDWESGKAEFVGWGEIVSDAT